MSLKNVSRWLLVAACAGMLPLYAQTTTTTSTTTTTTTTKTATHRIRHKAAVKAATGAEATRLAALLRDTQSNATLGEATWKTIANEANSLANRVYAGARGAVRTPAREARTHVREMHAAAMKGDTAGAKSHAGMALPFVYQVIDAAK